MMNVLIILYVISVLFPWVSMGLYDLAVEQRKKRLGYVNVEKKGFFEDLMICIPTVFITLIISLIPIINIGVGCIVFKDFEKDADEYILKEYKDNEIKKIENIKITQDEYVNKRIQEVKEYQKMLGIRNQVTSISDYSVDEKIAFLLRELELAYEEKLNEMEKNNKGNTLVEEDEVLKKVLRIEEHSEE